MSEPRDTDSAAVAHALLQNFYVGTEANRIDYARAFDPNTESDGYRRIQRWAAPLAEDQPGVLVRNTPRWSRVVRGRAVGAGPPPPRRGAHRLRWTVGVGRDPWSR